MTETKKYIIKYSIGTLVALGIFFLAISLKGIWMTENKQEIYRALADGFTLPAVIFLGGGLIVFVANRGAFYGIGYAIKWFFVKLIPFTNKKHETYGDYLENRKPMKGYYFLYIIGGVFSILAIIFTILFYNV